jgi:dinuclear metal center YbgI/SA1388 family protein
MRIADLAQAVETIAPLELAEPWDNVGLILGDPDAELSGPVVLTIDLTEAVADEAIGLKAAAIIAYHPPIFSSIKRVVSGPGSSATQRIAVKLLRAGIGVYSPHTALDAAGEGMTDWLADGVLDDAARQARQSMSNAGGDRRALSPAMAQSPTQEVKIVTFVPESEAEQVRGALASAGAGIIGGYDVCSFAIPGTGTFRGAPGTNPTVGEPGELESVSELRLEMVCSRRALGLALATLRGLHPYEEPAIDVYPLEKLPDRAHGVGRRVQLEQGATLEEICKRLKSHLGIAALQLGIGAGMDAKTVVSRIGVVPGAGASVANTAVSERCQVFVTGEMKHHDVVAATAAGMSVVLAGHTSTERGFLPRLKERLERAVPGVAFFLSREDREPLLWV